MSNKLSYPRTKYETPTRLPSLQPQAKYSGHITATPSSTKSRNLTARIHNKATTNALNTKKKKNDISEVSEFINKIFTIKLLCFLYKMVMFKFE